MPNSFSSGVSCTGEPWPCHETIKVDRLQRVLGWNGLLGQRVPVISDWLILSKIVSPLISHCAVVQPIIDQSDHLVTRSQLGHDGWNHRSWISRSMNHTGGSVQSVQFVSSKHNWSLGCNRSQWLEPSRSEG